MGAGDGVGAVAGKMSARRRHCGRRCNNTRNFHIVRLAHSNTLSIQKCFQNKLQNVFISIIMFTVVLFRSDSIFIA